MTEIEHQGTVAMGTPDQISRELLGKIVDEVFDGAIEDASVIEAIYAAIKKHETPPPQDHARGLTDDEKNFGVIRSFVPESTDDNRISVKQWRGDNDLITFGIFIGNHRWAECSMLPEDAAKVAALILSKPAVAALAASEGSADA